MTTGVRISNIGNISVKVPNLAYAVRQWQPNASSDPQDDSPGEFLTLATLKPDLGGGLTLAPGEVSSVLFASATGINGDRVKAMLARPDALHIEPAHFELENAQGLNFAFIEEVTRARTARVSIDFGDGRFEEYRIATNVKRNADGSLAGITLDRVMDLTVGVGNWETQGVRQVTNGSFELPVNFCCDPLEPDDWGVITNGLVASVHVANESINSTPPPPDGDQWVAFTMFGVSDGAIFQQIGVVTDNTDIDLQLHSRLRLDQPAF